MISSSANIDSFAAVVKKQNKNTWDIEPLLIQVDGSVHPPVSAITRSGIVPQPGDIVHVVTMRNNLDLDLVNISDSSSLANSIIVGVLKTTKYIYDYDREFNGNLEIKKNLTINKNLAVKGDLAVEGKIEVKGKLIIAGKDYTTHTHVAGTLTTSQGPVTGATGVVS